MPAATGGSGGEEPVNLFEAAAQAGDGSGARGARTGGAPAAAGAGGDALASLDFLRSNPHFQQLRQLVQQQPHMLEPILQQVAAGNPQIAQIIGQNSEQFLQLLSEDFDEDDEANLPPGTQAVSVTPEERDAIERVSLLSSHLIYGSLTFLSCAVLASLGIPSFRPTSPATRTRSLPQTSSLNSPMRRRIKQPLTYFFSCCFFTF